MSKYVDLPAPHSPGQQELLETDQNIIAFCGRRYGKTLIFVLRMILRGIKDPGLYLWVGLSWRSASMKWAWKLFKYFARMIWAAKGVTDTKKFIHEAEKEIIFPKQKGKSAQLTIWLRSAENPESIAGVGPKGIVCDEFPMYAADVWPEFIQPTTLDHDAWVVLTGSPKGENHASEFFNLVAAGKVTGWIARRFTSYDNPLINKTKIDEKRATTVSWLFDQEYMAMVIAGVGAALSKEIIAAFFDANVFERPPVPGVVYVAAVDPSGGGGNEFTMSVAHKEGDMIVQDCLMAELAPFPAVTTEKYCKKLKQYNVRKVTGDKYAGSWPAEQFQKHEVWYQVADKTASEFYEEFIPLFTQGKVKMLDDAFTREQLGQLLHKKTSTGRDQVVHPGSVDGTHGDRANSLAISAIVAHNADVSLREPGNTGLLI